MTTLALLQVKAKLKQCRLHKDSPLGDAMLECYSCTSKNVFALGFVPVKIENSAVLLCRDHKAHDPGLKELDLDLTSWQPLIEDRAFVPWLVSVPSEKVLHLLKHNMLSHFAHIWLHQACSRCERGVLYQFTLSLRSARISLYYGKARWQLPAMRWAK